MSLVQSPAARQARRLGTLWPAGIATALLFLFGAIAISRGPDASWDLRNYHLYDPFALLTGRLDQDVAPAQLQTYYVPVTDVVLHLLRTAFNRTPAVFEFLMAVPQALGAFLACLIAWKYVVAARPVRWAIVVIIALFGGTGTSSFGTLAIVQSEMIPGCFILGGLLLLLTGVERGGTAIWLCSGLAFGAAAALKLTTAPYAVAGACAVLVAGDGAAFARLRRGVVFGAGVVLALAVVAGWWWLHLYRDYGNPLFPYYNNLFHSPFLPDTAHTDENFKPKSLLQALLYAFEWGFTWHRPTSEATFRDPRFAFAQIATLAIVAALILDSRTRRDRLILPLIVFVGVSYCLWEKMFSIHRYLAPLELLTGLLIFLALRVWCQGPASRRVGAVLAVLAIAVTGYLTSQPSWVHATSAEASLDVRFPPIPSDSLVILAEDAPLSYAILAAPPSVRFVSVNSNMLHPGLPGLLQARADALANGWTGPVYSLETSEHDTAAVLSAYRLAHAGACLPVPSNLEKSPMQLCPLARRG